MNKDIYKIKEELSLLEYLWRRKNRLLEELELPKDDVLSLYDICNIISPENLELACKRIGNYIDEQFDNIDEIFDKLNKLTWVDDVRDLQPVAFVIKKYYNNYADEIIQGIEEMHNKYNTNNLVSVLNMCLFSLGLRK